MSRNHSGCYIRYSQCTSSPQSLSFARCLWEYTLDEVSSPLSPEERERLWSSVIAGVKHSNLWERRQQLRELVEPTVLQIDAMSIKRDILPSFLTIVRAMADLPQPAHPQMSLPVDDSNIKTVLTALAPVYGQYSRPCGRVGRRGSRKRPHEEAWLSTIWREPSWDIKDLCEMIDDRLSADAELSISISTACPRRKGLLSMRCLMGLIVKRHSEIATEAEQCSHRDSPSLNTRQIRRSNYSHSADCGITSRIRKLNIHSVESFQGIWNCVLNEVGSTLTPGERVSRWTGFISDVKQAHQPLNARKKDTLFRLCDSAVGKSERTPQIDTLLADLRYVVYIASNFPLPDNITSFSSKSANMRFMLSVLTPVYVHLSKLCATMEIRASDSTSTDWTDAVWNLGEQDHQKLYDLVDECDSKLANSSSNESARCVKRIGLNRLRRVVDTIIKQAASLENRARESDEVDRDHCALPCDGPEDLVIHVNTGCQEDLTNNRGVAETDQEAFVSQAEQDGSEDDFVPVAEETSSKRKSYPQDSISSRLRRRKTRQ